MPRPRTVDDEQILVAAARAVGAVGPARLTLADVAERVGLSPATLLQRFGSKRGLLLALAAHDVDEMPARIRAAARSEAVLPALVDVLSGFAESIGTPAEFANNLSFLLMDLADEDFQALSRQQTSGVRAAIEEVLEVARAAGQLRSGENVGELAGLVHVVYNGALVTWGMAPAGEPAETVARQLTALLDLRQRPAR